MKQRKLQMIIHTHPIPYTVSIFIPEVDFDKAIEAIKDGDFTLAEIVEITTVREV